MRNEISLFDSRKRSMITGAAVLILLVLFDQITKYVAVMKLRSQPPFILFDHVLELYYIENTGAAWGMLSGRQILLVLVTILAILILGSLYFQLPNDKKYALMHFLCLTMMAGAIGNLIDRLSRGYVVDFIYLSCIHFPIFNIADCYVTISALTGIILYRKELKEWMKNG